MPTSQRKINDLKKFAKGSGSLMSMFGKSGPPAPPVEPVVNLLDDECRPSETHDTSRDSGESLNPTKKRKRDGGHKIGYDDTWEKDRAWLLKSVDEDDDGNHHVVMYCKLCQKHFSGGKMCWVDFGCRSLRKDALVNHEKSSNHAEAVRAEIESRRNVTATFSDYSTSAKRGVQEALRITRFLVDHNLPISLYADLVDLILSTNNSDLRKLNAGKNATHTTSFTVNEYLTSLSTELEKTLVAEIVESPTYSILCDEVSDVASKKHLAILCRYVKPNGDDKTVLLNDVEIPNGTAETISNVIQTELKRNDLDLTKMSTLSADGASTFSGNKNGVPVKLRETTGNPSLIYNHCRDHRLALACKNTFAKIPLLATIDQLLNTLYKYYKYSTVKNSQLLEIQKAFNEPQLTMKEAKHHRWLSHDKAVSSLVKSYKCVVMELETHTIAGDATGNGLLKSLKRPDILLCFLLLADILPHLCQLSLFFQKEHINLGNVQSTVDRTLRTIEQTRSKDGMWLRKYETMAADIGLDEEKNSLSTNANKFDTGVRVKFVDALKENITARFEDAEVITNLACLDTSDLQSIPSFYAYTELEQLADHYSMDQDDLLEEWTTHVERLNDEEPENRTLAKVYATLTDKDLGLSVRYPLLTKLYAIAICLPLSTAGVERVFSQLKMIKTDKRNRLDGVSIDQLLRIKMNCKNEVFESIIEEAAENWLSMKKRRLAKDE